MKQTNTGALVQLILLQLTATCSKSPAPPRMQPWKQTRQPGLGFNELHRDSTLRFLDQAKRHRLCYRQPLWLLPQGWRTPDRPLSDHDCTFPNTDVTSDYSGICTDLAACLNDNERRSQVNSMHIGISRKNQARHKAQFLHSLSCCCTHIYIYI